MNPPFQEEEKSFSRSEEGFQPFSSSLSEGLQHKLPEISLPKGGGAVRGIDEQLEVNPVTGSSGLRIPFPVSESRGGLTPSLSISYSSGAGNGIFGLGWSLSLGSIVRKTNKVLPKYEDQIESDSFLLSGGEELVPKLFKNGSKWEVVMKQHHSDYQIKEYRSRVEGSWDRVEQWRSRSSGLIHWRTISSNNIVSVYGDSSNSRVADPSDATRIYEWKLSHRYDNLGNVEIYDYKAEDLVGVSEKIYEQHRTLATVSNSYLKRVHYGNKRPYRAGAPLPSSSDFLFEILLDYGDYSINNNASQRRGWRARRDAFSNFRCGFDLRTYRLCERVLLFHKFDLVDQPIKEQLVKSLDLDYSSNPGSGASPSGLEGFTYLKKAQLKGYSYDSSLRAYRHQSLPALSFSYQEHAWDTQLHELSDYSHLPVEINQGSYQWLDFYGEGLSGVLSEQSQGWYYQENLGGGELSSAQLLTEQPSFRGLQFKDLSGDGSRQLVNYGSSPAGYFERDLDGTSWSSFRYFESLPNRNWSKDPNARFIDLDGDGRADLLLTSESFFHWHVSKGKAGFGAANRVYLPLDEEEGPRVVFSDEEQSIFLADMTGDGLTDIVRIRNGSVSYWANKGYGNFSSKIRMGQSPTFDHMEQFNPRNLYLLDIDGSGTTDLAYYHRNQLQIWCNWSGNEFVSSPKIVDFFPSLVAGTRLDVVDLLGTGTSCLVWSSSQPKDSRTPLRYIDLTGGKKPHLLRQYSNNLGAETELSYSPSTKYYLSDKKAGRPWASKLPFPVHVVEEVKRRDHIQGTLYTQKYSYGHGYYDRKEREFRGFGRVETLDTTSLEELQRRGGGSNVQAAHYQEAIKTISWYHTGASLEEESLLSAYEREYYSNALEARLPSFEVPREWSGDAYIEAHRSLKGSLLRQEVYRSEAGSNVSIPYLTSRYSYGIRQLQPHEGQKYACFVVIPEQQFSYHYEENASDPRISQELVLATDSLGMPLASASIIYPRVSLPSSLPWMVREAQEKEHVILRKMRLTEDIDEVDAYRLRRVYEEQVYEVLQAKVPRGARYFTVSSLNAALSGAQLLDYIESPTTPNVVYQRLHGHSKVQWLKDDLSAPLPIGKLSSLGIEYKTYELAYTGLQLSGDSSRSLSGIYTTLSGRNLLQGLQPLSNWGYVDLEGNGNWWLPSGQTLYGQAAANNFYLPAGVEDILGNQSKVTYDSYKLLPLSVTDALGNSSRVAYDYRVLQAKLLTDINENQSAVAFDELGMVVKTAVMGKAVDQQGDSLLHPSTELSYGFYDASTGQPNYIHTKIRAQHYFANPSAAVDWQERYEYSNGSGVVLMTKVETKGGKAKHWDSRTNSVVEIDTRTDPIHRRRWIGTGRTVVNNKGLPIKQYEPYFSVTAGYETAPELVEIGYSPTLYYDALGRNHYTELANGTIEKTEFDAWYSKHYDANDTIKESRVYRELSTSEQALVNGSTAPAAAHLRSIWQSVQHSNTPTTTYTDCLGGAIYVEQELEAGVVYSGVLTQTDLGGRYSKLYDELTTKELLQNGVGNYQTNRGQSSRIRRNLLGQEFYNWTAVKGSSWTFTDALGRLVRLWDHPEDAVNRVEYSMEYDGLHRPLKTYVRQGSSGSWICFAKTIYGETLPQAKEQNLLGQAYQSYDQSGVVTTVDVDFKGNVLRQDRQMMVSYEGLHNWDTTVALEGEVFTTRNSYDALNRPVETKLADGSILVPSYNKGGYMEQLQVDVLGRGTPVTYLSSQDYDAKGQQERLVLGNGTLTQFFYESTTFRLQNLLTTKNTEKLQDIHYHYDAVGNATEIRDLAQSSYYYNNRAVSPQKRFEYDAMYRLLSATGRQHAGVGVVGVGQRDFYEELPSQHIQSAVTNYTRRYAYDEGGNLLRMRQVGAWTRSYRYAVNTASNQLLETHLSGHSAISYSYDHRGNMKGLPHLQALEWNHKEELVKVELDSSGNVAHYNYDGGGARIRKVISRNGRKQKERLYLGGLERYREYDNAGVVKVERWTLQVDGIAQLDTLMVENSSAVAVPVPVVRYQYRDRLGSSTIECNEQGQVISYEDERLLFCR